MIDEKLSTWWRELPPDFRLTPSKIATLPPDVLPRILLMNIVYHQSLCALHASIVPLFSWAAGDGWLSARQLSAQVAFEHACAASELIRAVLSTFDRLTAMPSFIAYAAYSGCAIQVPFMWSSNPAVRERAHANVLVNVKMLHTLRAYWRFAALLVSDCVHSNRYTLLIQTRARIFTLVICSMLTGEILSISNMNLDLSIPKS